MVCCSVRGSHAIDAADCTGRSSSQCLYNCLAEAMPRQGSPLFDSSAPTLLGGDDVLLKHALAVGDVASHRPWDILSREFSRPPWGEPAVRVIPAFAACSAGAVGVVGLTKHTASGRCPAGLSCADRPQFRMLSGSALQMLGFIVRAWYCTLLALLRYLAADTRR